MVVVFAIGGARVESAVDSDALVVVGRVVCFVVGVLIAVIVLLLPRSWNHEVEAALRKL